MIPQRLQLPGAVVELGFTSTCGIIHDGTGQLKPLGDHEMTVYRQLKGLRKRSYSRFNYSKTTWQQGKPNDWRCRAGAR